MPIRHAVGDWTITNIQYFRCKRDFRKVCIAAEPDQGHSRPLFIRNEVRDPLQQIFQNANDFKIYSKLGKGYKTLKFIVIWPFYAIEHKATPNGINIIQTIKKGAEIIFYLF